MRALTASLIVALAAGLAAQGVPPPPPPPPPPVPMMAGQGMRDTMKPPPTGTSVMAGAVLSDESAPQPIRRARVSINNSDGTVFKTAVTDDAGRYSFTQLPAGRYSLSATKPGYVRMNYGARRADRPGTTVLVADAQKVTDLDMKLPRGGVITGRVLDETGQPAFGVSVRLLQYRMAQGERTLQPALAGGGMANDTSDDRGVFRLYGLPAGEYVLSAQPRATTNMEIRAMTDQEVRAAIQAAQQMAAARATGAGSTAGVPGSTSGNTPPATPREYTTVGYTPVFFPGTPIAANAAPIVLAAGEERSNVDVQVQLVRTARIEGVVVTPPAIPPQTVTLTMTATGPNANAGSLLGFSLLNRATPGPDGKFSFTSVPPGQYTISARATERPQGGRGGAPAAGRGETFEFQTRVVGTAVAGGGAGEAPMIFNMAAPPGQGPVFWGTLDVGVNGQNLSDLNISLQPGLTLAGRVMFDGKKLAPPTDLTRTRINMMPVQTGNVVMLGGLPAAVVDQSGKFTISGIVPGRYRLDGSSPMTVGQGWMVKSIVARGRDVLDFPLEIGPGDDITDAVVMFTDVTQEVGGTLQDPTGRPAPDYTIVIFPADNRLWSSPLARRIRMVRPGTDGKFTIANLPAGEYRLAALTDITPGDQTDPSFLQQLVVASIPISLADGEKKVQDIRIGG